MGWERIAISRTAAKSLCWKFFFPFFAQCVVHPVAELNRHRIRLAVLEECDGLADVVHDHLAGIAARHVLLELDTDSRVNRAIPWRARRTPSAP